MLNIACGSCRELFDMAPLLRLHQPQVICIDHDSAALEYARLLLSSNAISLDSFQFQRYNAYRLVNPKTTRRDFGAQVIIYSAGLFDYIKDEPLIKILSALFSLLNPKGKLISLSRTAAATRREITTGWSIGRIFTSEPRMTSMRFFKTPVLLKMRSRIGATGRGRFYFMLWNAEWSI